MNVICSCAKDETGIDQVPNLCKHRFKRSYLLRMTTHNSVRYIRRDNAVKIVVLHLALLQGLICPPAVVDAVQEEMKPSGDMAVETTSCSGMSRRTRVVTQINQNRSASVPLSMVNLGVAR